MYHIISHKHLIYYVRMAEYRYKIKDKSQIGKVMDLLDSFQIIQNVSDTEFPESGFISDSDNSNGTESDENSNE